MPLSLSLSLAHPNAVHAHVHTSKNLLFFALLLINNQILKLYSMLSFPKNFIMIISSGVHWTMTSWAICGWENQNLERFAAPSKVMSEEMSSIELKAVFLILILIVNLNSRNSSFGFSSSSFFSCLRPCVSVSISHSRTHTHKPTYFYHKN